MSENNVINNVFPVDPPEITSLEDALKVLEDETLKLKYDIMQSEKNAGGQAVATSMIGTKMGISSKLLQDMLARQNAQKRLMVSAYERIIDALKAPCNASEGHADDR